MMWGNVAVVLGGASCWREDLAGLEDMIGGRWGGVVLATNETGAAWPYDLDHWVSLHPEKMPAWREARAKNGYAPAGVHWAHCADARVDQHHTGRVRMHGGSSGLLATAVALEELGCYVVLCGVPMDDGPNAFSGKPWTAHGRYCLTWGKVVADPTSCRVPFRERVRSMSGWTRDLLGMPNLTWLRAAGFRRAA